MKPSCARVLARLRAANGQWVPGMALAMPDTGGLRFGGRIYELRQMGFTVERRPSPRGSAVDEYRLVEAAHRCRIAGCPRTFDSIHGLRAHEARGHLDVDALFWSKVDQSDGSEACWRWLGSRDHLGYGRVRRDGHTVLAHRTAWELSNGSIPGGLTLDHLCRVRSCCNPRHLEPVDHRTNVLRGVGPTAVNAQKTHCPYGHPLTVMRSNQRVCAVCPAKQSREYRARRKQKREQPVQLSIAL